MAAVLCGGIGKLVSGCCECVGQVCMLPFKICGACCEGMGKCCSESCNFITNCCSSPFCCYITVACALNIPPIVVGLTDVPNAVAGCAGSLWLLVFWILCLVHIVAAFYMAYAVEKDDSILPSRDEEHGMAQFQQTAQNGAGRMKQLFCYDYWMAAYILVLMGHFGWLFVGGAWFASGTMDDDDSCEDINGRVGIAYGFGWAFVFLGGCGLCCSLCCGIFNSPPGNRRPPAVAQQQQSSKPATIPTGNATAAPENDDPKASSSGKNGSAYATGSTTSKPMHSSTMEPPEVEVEAVPASNPKPSAPMASAVPY